MISQTDLLILQKKINVKHIKYICHICIFQKKYSPLCQQIIPIVTMLEKEFDFFCKNKEAIYAKYPDKFVVIKGLSVQCAADSFEEALAMASDKYELGTFIVLHCTKDESGYTQTFHSRVIFA